MLELLILGLQNLSKWKIFIQNNRYNLLVSLERNQVISSKKKFQEVNHLLGQQTISVLNPLVFNIHLLQIFGHMVYWHIKYFMVNFPLKDKIIMKFLRKSGKAIFV